MQNQTILHRVLCRTFESKDEQDKWVASEIIKNIREEELRADDIIVINPDPFSTRYSFGTIRKLLNEAGISSHIAGVDSSPDVFFDLKKESVTFTGIYRAKGNEAAMVYVINSHDCFGDEFMHTTANVAKLRNRLFTAITRSKAWVRVVGVGSTMDLLKKEIDMVKEHNYRLEFVYPTAEQRKKMNIVNRDMSQIELDRVNKNRKNWNDILTDLLDRKIFIEDLGEDAVNKMKEILNSGDRKCEI